MVSPLKLLCGSVLYLLELALNFNLFMQHPSDTALVIIFILLFATFLVNIVAAFSRAGKISLCFYVVAFFLQMCVIVRHVEELLVNDDENRSRKRLPVHFAQALLYSALQCVVHCYLIVQLGSFPPYVVASFVVSFFSLLWGFALVTPYDYSFEDDENADEPSQPSRFCSVVLIIGQVGFLISRLLLLAFFCWSFGPFITLVFAPQIILVQLFAYGLVPYFLLCHFCIQYFNCCSDMKMFAYSTWKKTITVLVSIFDVTICSPGYNWLVALYFLQSLVMFCVQMWVKPFFPQNIETLRFVTLRVVLGAFGVGCVFSGVVFCSCIDDVSSQPATNQVNYPGTVQASTRVREDPVQSPTAAYVVKRGLYDVSLDGVVVERTEVYGIERC